MSEKYLKEATEKELKKLLYWSIISKNKYDLILLERKI
jgi:hypothetical protein